MSLVVPQGNAFSVLGHSCGGIQEQAFATGFDPTTGYPVGDVYLSTRCGGSGRGGGYHTTTYSAWVSATWDYTGTFVSSTTLSGAPSVDPAFSAFDAFGNEVYNASNRAYLLLAPTFVPPPRVLGISPTFGPSAGGTSVTVTGTGFTGATTVFFGSVPAASDVVNNDTSITAVSPVMAAGTVDVTVASPGGTSAPVAADQFRSYGLPTVTGLSPTRGLVAGGTTVTIAGTHLEGATSVMFGDTAVGFTVNSETSITASSPASDSGADSVSVTVTTPGGTSPASSAAQFAYVDAVPGLSVTPSSGPTGTAVLVKGGGYSPGEQVRVWYVTGLASPPFLFVCASTTDSIGSFSCVGAIPSTNAGAAGAHALVAVGVTSQVKYSTHFTLT